jgi:uncharacterized protein YdhG (YjbR/CyaY superfamily)
MDTKSAPPQSMDEYIASFPLEIQKILQEIRLIVQKAAPEASEKISYGMPTFALKGNLVHFAAFKNHIGFYSTPSGTSEFQQEILETVLSCPERKNHNRFSINRVIHEYINASSVSGKRSKLRDNRRLLNNHAIERSTTHRHGATRKSV